MRGLSSFACEVLGTVLVAGCWGPAFESATGGRQSSDASAKVARTDGSGDFGRGGSNSGLGGAHTGDGGAPPAGGGATSGSATSSGGTATGSGGTATGAVSGASGGSVGNGGVGITGRGGTGGGVVGATGGRAPSLDASAPDASPVACSSATDCPRSGTVCQKAACLGNQCGFVADPGATPLNVRGDCRQIVCAQNGIETILSDPSDTDDSNECTVDACQGNVASHKPSTGARCASGTKYCDAVGACVDCLVDANCPAGTTDECSKAKCINGSCRIPAAGTFCHAGKDQCDGAGTCLDCWDSLGCDGCCFCMDNICIQG